LKAYKVHMKRQDILGKYIHSSVNFVLSNPSQN